MVPTDFRVLPGQNEVVSSQGVERVRTRQIVYMTEEKV